MQELVLPSEWPVPVPFLWFDTAVLGTAVSVSDWASGDGPTEVTVPIMARAIMTIRIMGLAGSLIKPVFGTDTIGGVTTSITIITTTITNRITILEVHKQIARPQGLAI